MSIFTNLVKSLFIVAVTGWMAGCGSSDENSVDEKGAEMNLSISISDKLRALPPTGTLKAYVSVDGGSRVAMDISGSDASKSLSLSPGSHTFTIEFEFESTTYGTVDLASSTKTADISSGSSSVSFSTTEYTYDDDDGDGLTNLSELSDDTNPTSSVCELDFSLLGSCTLG